MELFARIVDVEGSSGGSALNPPTNVIEENSSAILVGQQVTTYVLPPSFVEDLSVQADNADDLVDVHTWGEFAAAVRATLVLDGAPAFMEVKDRDPLTEAIGDDDQIWNHPLFEDSDGEEDTTPVGRSQAQSISQTQQHPPHFYHVVVSTSITTCAQAVHISLIGGHPCLNADSSHSIAQLPFCAALRRKLATLCRTLPQLGRYMPHSTAHCPFLHHCR
ncbi:hypothetical protein S83_039160 [Arachis hypogaea]